MGVRARRESELRQTDVAHISVRLFWHDNGWNGCICKNPSQNVCCERHDHIRDHKDVKAEQEEAGTRVCDGTVRPPCEGSVQAYSPHESEIDFYPPSWMFNVKPVRMRLPPMTCTLWPFENMWNEDQSHKTNEERRALAERFRRSIIPGKSLVFFYVDESNPLLVEDEERSPARVLVGVSVIGSVGEIREYEQEDHRGNINMVWAIPFQHAYPENGVKLPVHELLNSLPDAEEREQYLLALRGGLRADFRYWSHHVSIDRAVVALERAIQSLRAIEKERPIEGDFSTQTAWLSDQLLSLWRQRGPYPGIGAVLAALDCPDSASVQIKLVSALIEKGKDAVEEITGALESNTYGDLLEEFQDDLEYAAEEWKYLDEGTKELIRILCRMDLLKDHAKHILDEDQRAKHGLPRNLSTILENPYILCESYIPDEGRQGIDFAVVDHGLLPHEVMGKIRGLRVGQRDPRRLRALLVQILREAGGNGHTFIEARPALEGARRLSPDDRPCNVPFDRLSHPDFVGVLEQMIELFEYGDVQYFALNSLRLDEIGVREVLDEMLQRKRIRSRDTIDWQGIEHSIAQRRNRRPLELSAEQLQALERSFESPVSVITGAAGTGKSSLLSPLIKGIRRKSGRVKVLALAPTGKAADRLRQLDVEAMTIHRALAGADWYDWDLGVLKREGERTVEANTIIIDEASMVPISLLATLFRATRWPAVARVVLVGDYHQLPPIGPGRPFYDIVAEFQKADSAIEEDGERKPSFENRLTDLTHNYRVEKGSRAIALANAYAGQPEAEVAEIFSSVASGEDVGDLRVRFWNTPEELHELLLLELRNIIPHFAQEFNLTGTDFSLFNEMIGHNEDVGLTYWQSIGPVKGESYGTRKINAVVQDEFHAAFKKYTSRWYGVKFGNEAITRFDRVIQIINEKRDGYNVKVGGEEEVQIYNGQFGVVRTEYPKANKRMNKGKGRPKEIRVLLDGLPDHLFSYRSKGLDSAVNGRLELAYTITVHKCQGSQFRHVFFIWPLQTGNLMSRELAYTGLTRAQGTLTLFIEKNISSLLAQRRLSAAETPRRNSRLFGVYAGGTGRYRYDGHVYVSKRGEWMASKSEVIVANLLDEAGLDYKYEEELMPTGDPRDMRLPDFTISHKGRVYYWEHCGMVDDPIYRKKWEEVRKPWYKKHNLESVLIVSQDEPGGGIDSREIVKLIQNRILQET